MSLSEIDWFQQWNLVKMVPSNVDSIADYIQVCCNCLVVVTNSQACFTGFDLAWINTQLCRCLHATIQFLSKVKIDFVKQCNESQVLKLLVEIVSLCKKTVLVSDTCPERLLHKVSQLLLLVIYIWKCCKVENDLCLEFIKFSKLLIYLTPKHLNYDSLSLFEMVELHIQPASKIYYIKQEPEEFLMRGSKLGIFLYHLTHSLYQAKNLSPFVEKVILLSDKLVDNESYVLLFNLLACHLGDNKKFSQAKSCFLKKVFRQNLTDFFIITLINMSILYKNEKKYDEGFKFWKMIQKKNILTTIEQQENKFIFKNKMDICIKQDFNYSSIVQLPSYNFYFAVYSILAKQYKEAFQLCEKTLSSFYNRSDGNQSFQQILPFPTILKVHTTLNYCQCLVGDYKLSKYTLSVINDTSFDYCVSHYKASYQLLLDSSSSEVFQDYLSSVKQLHYLICLKLYQANSLFSQYSFSAVEDVLRKCLVYIKGLPEVSSEKHNCQEDCIQCKKNFYKILLQKDHSKLLFNYAFACCNQDISSNFRRNDILMALHKAMQLDINNLDLRWDCVLVLFKIGLKLDGIKVWCKTRNIELAMVSDEIDCIIAIKSEELEFSDKKDLLERDISVLQEMYLDVVKMVSLLQTQRVKYLISDELNHYESLANLYFCIYCLKLRSANNLQHEIESHFCPQTLDSWSTNDVATTSKKNKSSNSWHCPSCQNPLTVSSYNTSFPASDGTDKILIKKSYYQYCSSCRWSSREVGIPDKEFASGLWKEKVNPNQQRVDNLVEYFKYLSHKEALDKKSLVKVSPHLVVTRQIHQRYSKSPASFSRQMKESMSLKEVKIEESATVSVDEIERLPEGIFTEDLNITKMTSIQQRHGLPAIQPTDVGDLTPYSMIALIRRSLRCKKCDHNLIKAEYNPASTKFKIHLIALLHVPEIRINKQPKLVAGKQCPVHFSLINPTEHLIKVTFTNVPVDEAANKIDLPAETIQVARLDETAEFADVDLSSTRTEADNPKVILHRDGNRVIFIANVTPDDQLKPGQHVFVTFNFEHEHYKNSAIVSRTQLKGEVPKPEAVMLTQTVVIDLGVVEAE